MTIKNKDGSIFRLRGPNPLAKEQNQWDDEADLVLHNMNWDDVELPQGEDVEKFNSNFDVKDSGDDEVTVIEEPKPVEATPPEEIPVVVPEVKKDARPRERTRNSVDIWCLPATIREHHDPLYDQVTKTIQYGEKVMLEGIVVNNDGFTMTFWTNVEIPKKGSIVYVSRNSVGDSYLEKRWWRVERMIDSSEEERLKESGGFLFYCVPSAFTPDFSP
tara:strand:+ start:1849 stop:2499 length:651 start_codon:yes stop_codon:yes gene_type:complete